MRALQPRFGHFPGKLEDCSSGQPASLHSPEFVIVGRNVGSLSSVGARDSRESKHTRGGCCCKGCERWPCPCYNTLAAAVEAQQHDDDTPQRSELVWKENIKNKMVVVVPRLKAAFAPGQMIKDQDSHNQWPRRRDNDSQTPALSRQICLQSYAFHWAQCVLKFNSVKRSRHSKRKFFINSQLSQRIYSHRLL